MDNLEESHFLQCNRVNDCWKHGVFSQKDRRNKITSPGTSISEGHRHRIPRAIETNTAFESRKTEVSWNTTRRCVVHIPGQQQAWFSVVHPLQAWMASPLRRSVIQTAPKVFCTTLQASYLRVNQWAAEFLDLLTFIRFSWFSDSNPSVTVTASPNGPNLLHTKVVAKWYANWANWINGRCVKVSNRGHRYVRRRW